MWIVAWATRPQAEFGCPWKDVRSVNNRWGLEPVDGKTRPDEGGKRAYKRRIRISWVSTGATFTFAASERPRLAHHPAPHLAMLSSMLGWDLKSRTCSWEDEALQSKNTARKRRWWDKAAKRCSKNLDPIRRRSSKYVETSRS